MIDFKSRFLSLVFATLAAFGGATAARPAAAEVVASTQTRPGPVRGTSENSDAFIWRLMVTQIAAPATPGHPTPAAFEGWASDIDVFQTTPPHFPTLNEPHKFQRSLLRALTAPGASAIDAPCNVPQNPAAGGFPVGSTTQCIAEEVKRNRPQFDYIVNNGLYTQAGIASAFARSFTVNMPAAAISVKGDWIPVATMIQWIPQLGSVAGVEKAYLTTTVSGVEYALVSLHVSSKQNAKWVWATFEHRLTPGRCDYIGCYDSFGAITHSVPPNLRTYNTQYGACPKNVILHALMVQFGLSPVWENYCLKGTQVDYTAFGDRPSSLANSVTEGINANVAIVAGSCISCHAYAIYGANGKATPAAINMLAFNPTGTPIPGALVGGKGYDFMWGFQAAQ